MVTLYRVTDKAAAAREVKKRCRCRRYAADSYEDVVDDDVGEILNPRAGLLMLLVCGWCSFVFCFAGDFFVAFAFIGLLLKGFMFSYLRGFATFVDFSILIGLSYFLLF